jgi:hypothetical protein
MTDETTIKLPTVVLFTILGVGAASGAGSLLWPAGKEPITEEEARQIHTELGKKQYHLERMFLLYRTQNELKELDKIMVKTPEQQREYNLKSRMASDITLELDGAK